MVIENTLISTKKFFKLKPLWVYVRFAIAGGCFMSATALAQNTLPVPAQTWATKGDASQKVIGRTLQIKQNSDKAILNWDSFNVGAKNRVEFVQPNSSSVALNRIFQADPSKILGKVDANGQVYLYNKNGFVFGKNSTVNTNTLIASTLDVADEVFERGVVREFDDTGNAALQAADDAPANAEIRVQKGAKIHVGKNGRLLIAAPKVNNEGELSTDEQGQIILVASKDKVYLQPADNSGPFAGLLVEVGSGGEVTNQGEVLARQGNVTLAGFAVNQAGRVKATTSVNVNGSIRLLAREHAEKQSEVLVATQTQRNSDEQDGLGKDATVTFAPNSVTEVVADQDGGTAIDEQAQPDSYIEVSAKTVHLQSKSQIKAPSGNIEVTATDDLIDPSQGSEGRILLEKDAVIDVSGSKHIAVPMERNVVEVPVQSYELRDAPQQRGGVLQGQTVRVDSRKDTKIVDTSGAVARFNRGIEERLAKGGDIHLLSSGDVVVNSGAKVNISGGSVDYQDGYIDTTHLLGEDGRIVDISDANPDQHYTSVIGVVKETNDKWGTTKTWDSPLQGRFEKGYTEGKAAGALSIDAPLTQWSGKLVAGTAKSPYQRGDSLPFGGSFHIDSTTFNVAQGVLFQNAQNPLTLGITDGVASNSTLVLSSQSLEQSGVQNVSVKTLGDVSVSESTRIALSPKSQLVLEAGTLNVQGHIYSAGGDIRLSSSNNGLLADAGKMTLGAKAEIDVSGRWVNDIENGLDITPTETLAIDGGLVNLTATGDLISHAAIKADGGAWLAQNGELRAGKGGNISLAATGSGGKAALLQANGLLSALAMFDNGSLSLSSGKIMVGIDDTAPAPNENELTPLALGIKSGKFIFAPNMGFSGITLTSNFDDLEVAEGTTLNLVADNRVLQGDITQIPSGASLAGFSRVETLPEQLRKPVDLNLTALRNVVLKTGSQINADKQADIHLNTTEEGIYVDGEINAPAGFITLTTHADTAIQYNDAQAIWLAEHAKLNTIGTTRLNPLDGLGRQTGEVLAGGDITLNAQRGYVLLKQGSALNVSGSQGTLDLPQLDGSNLYYTPTVVGSDAGKIIITAAEGAVLDGSLHGKAGSISAHSGNLELNLNRLARSEMPAAEQLIGKEFPTGEMTLNVTQTQTLRSPSSLYGQSIPLELNGKASVSSDSLADFGSVRLSSPNTLQFQGNVTLNASERLTLDAQKLAWQADNAATGAVNLNTHYLTVGSSLVRQVNGVPDLGGGVLTANAQWTELTGASLWQGFSDISLNSAHDLRTVGIRTSDSERDFLGTLVTAANVQLQASQIYPSTLSNFTFALNNNPNGQITVTRSANSDVSPLSANGVLTINAPMIAQNGILKAPLGKINLTATTSLTLGSGSVTSVSAAGQLIPLGVTQGGLDWLYPLDSFRNLVFNAPTDKQLTLAAPEVSLAKNSVVDLSGGGDLLAYEFLPGSGGSEDYLQVGSKSYQGGFAVLPSLGKSIAPFDHLQSTDFNYAVGSSVFLSGTDALPAGEYTVLPARYALLPNAFLVTPQANTQDQLTTTFTAEGLPIVSGYQSVSGTAIRDARTSGFLIEQGSDIRKHSQYDEQTANGFYANRAIKNETSVPLLPQDSGLVSIAAQNQLVLEGDFNVATQDGRGARMDITADRLKIVKNLSATPTVGTLEVLADQLSQLGVDSLFLGGTRSSNSTTGFTDLNVTAQEVLFDTDAQMQVTDLIAAAKTKVEVKDGATLVASGTVNTGDSTFSVIGDGALLRLSADEQVILSRSDVLGQSGEINIEKGATLKAEKSLLIDASQSTTLAGNIDMKGGSLNLSANAINIGEVDGLASSALNLSNEKLQNLSVQELVLNSRDTINFYGNVGEIDKTGVLQPIGFDSLVMNAAGFSGFGDKNQAAKLQANQLQLENTTNALASHTSQGQGELAISATHYTQAVGDFAMTGFDKIALTAETFSASGKSNLNLNGNLNLNAGVITAAGGANLTIDASGHTVALNSLDSSVPTQTTTYGSAIAVTADAIAMNANVLLPSGALNLHALSGDVQVGDKAVIDVAGRAVNFADTIAYSAGGTFSAIADHGNIHLSEGSQLNLSSGGGTAAGGQLTLKAPEKSLTLAGQLKATSGSAAIDIAHFDKNSSFDQLMKTLTTAGINQSIDFRSRHDDIVQAAGESLHTDALNLVTDSGNIVIAGTLNADGSQQGGSLKLTAGDNITLSSGGVLSAKGNQGGNILLSSVDGDNDKQSGIALQSGSTIDVSGSSSDNGGKVTLQALRTDSDNNGIDDGVNIQPIAGTVQGYQAFYAEGVKKYSNADFFSAGQIGSDDISRLQNDTATYMSMTNMQNVNAQLGGGIRLRPAIEINVAGDLTLASKWDLASWRYNETTDKANLAGTLTLNATGNLNFTNALSDGFKDDYLVSGIFVTDLLQSGDSWSYQLNAGKDLIIGTNSTVRTGSGDMQLNAAGNISFADQTATVYNAGRPDDTARYGSLNDLVVGYLFYSEYPVAGGDLTMTAGQNITGAVSDQFIDSWLVRQGNWSSNSTHANELASAWGVALGYTPYVGNIADSSAPLFQQNIGSFGGGNVNIRAAGSINDLSVMMPTTGKQIGVPDTATFSDFLTNQVQVQASGALSVNAGGDIAGGAYYLGKGDGTLNAGGAIIGGRQFTKGIQLVMSDSNLTLNANKGIAVGAVSDAMVLHSGKKVVAGSADSNFFSYGDNSGIALNSLSGDVQLGADTSVIGNVDLLNLEGSQSRLSEIYPASLNATAFGGSVLANDEITLFPAADSSLALLANQSISSSSIDSLRVSLSDADKALLPSALLPLAKNNLSDTEARLNPFGIPTLIHAAQPVHTGDTQPVRIVTQQGDIDNIQFNLPKKAIVQAGRDVSNVLLAIQHVNADDTSVLSANRDIRYTSERSADGGLAGNINKIEIAGGGDVLVKAGRNIDLGASIGLSTIGNVLNQNLPSGGANLTVLTGLNGRDPDYAAFFALMKDSETYPQLKTLISDFMRNKDNNPTLSEDDALAAFVKLPPSDYLAIQPQLNTLVNQAFFNELKIAGTASAGDSSAGNERGFKAIETLFPQQNWQGDLNLFFSKLQTIQGGNINLLVPGGEINAGLAVSFNGSKPSSELGIVAQGTGDINAFVHNDFIVNQSRVFALSSGDILIWSSEGDIDAGRGAKSAIAAPPPIVSFDKSGNLVIEFPPIVSGSGIRTAATFGNTAGDVFLFAPKGVVNAGEAGIGGTNVTISATAVLGANNIQVGGISTGVPAASGGSLAAGLTGVSNLNASVSQVAQASADMSKDNEKSNAEKATQNFKLGTLSIDILGYGDNDSEENRRKNKPAL